MTGQLPSSRFTVSSYRNETVKQRHGILNIQRNIRATMPLKFLALLVLERNRQRNKHETGAFQSTLIASYGEAELLVHYAGEYEERSAIYQYDGRHSRSVAEWRAMNDVLGIYSEAQRTAVGSDHFNSFMLSLHAMTRFNKHTGGNYD